MLFGDPAVFAFEVGEKDAHGQHTFRLFVQGVDILEGVFQGRVESYCWNTDEIVAWLAEHLWQLMEEDTYPVPVTGETAAELYANSFSFDGTDDEEDRWYTQVQDWLWRHSWVEASAGSYLATVFFRRVGDRMEISWDNSDHPRVVFAHPKGKALVDCQTFAKVMAQLCEWYV